MDIKLTQYSHGAGCGCKISPKVLDEILQSSVEQISDARLIVGNASKDDAAVFDLGDGTGVISTTDFFMPIVDDPVDFGRIASTNAISDVYAMGGTPVMAISVLGWPVNTVPIEAARLVLEGARQACSDAGIVLAGGHSIDSPEPIFGLAVTGRIDLSNLKTNTGGRENDVLYLTKPLGIGILSTAQKKNVLKNEHSTLARDVMVQLNSVGQELGKHSYVHAITDVTGFGLLGHLIELCEGSNLSAQINFQSVPLINDEIINHYLDLKCIPGGTNRNWDSYGQKITDITERQRHILCDPQTSGGLLVSVDPSHEKEFTTVLSSHDIAIHKIGLLTRPSAQTIIIKN